jgi:hypothetical protein
MRNKNTNSVDSLIIENMNLKGERDIYINYSMVKSVYDEGLPFAQQRPEHHRKKYNIRQ